MKSNYHEKREARIKRFKELAAKNELKSEQAYKAAKEIGSFIPMGQPILVGHHSEGRHRRDIAKIDNNMRKSVEASEKSGYYQDRAETAERNKDISSDNPEAITLLKEKIEKLTKTQEFYKAANKIIKSVKLSEGEKVEKLEGMGLTNKTATELLIPEYGRLGIPSYKLTNNNAKIRAAEARLKQLEKVESMEEQEFKAGECTVKISPEHNRIMLQFPGKPAQEIIDLVKSWGFHWSRYEGVWMRKITGNAMYALKQVVNKLKEETA